MTSENAGVYRVRASEQARSVTAPSVELIYPQSATFFHHPLGREKLSSLLTVAQLVSRRTMDIL